MSNKNASSAKSSHGKRDNSARSQDGSAPASPERESGSTVRKPKGGRLTKRRRTDSGKAKSSDGADPESGETDHLPEAEMVEISGRAPNFEDRSGPVGGSPMAQARLRVERPAGGGAKDSDSSSDSEMEEGELRPASAGGLLEGEEPGESEVYPYSVQGL
jgi:hypothetical protein